MRVREEGEGRRIQLKKNDITCAVRGREREREGMGGSVNEERASGGKLH